MSIVSYLLVMCMYVKLPLYIDNLATRLLNEFHNRIDNNRNVMLNNFLPKLQVNTLQEVICCFVFISVSPGSVETQLRLS